MRCSVSCAGRAGRLLMSTVCVYVYAVAHLQLELLGFVFLDSCLLHSSGRREGGDVEFLFRNLSNGVWSGGSGKLQGGDGERGNDGGGSRVESLERDVCWRGDGGDPRGEGGV